jgi:hypothetical protein
MSLESEIKRRISIEIGSEEDFLLLDNPIGVAVFDQRRVKYGLGGPGAPDMIGILFVEGIGGFFVGMEVKQPGQNPKPHQREIHELWSRFGALIYTIHSPEEARAALEDARKKCREPRKPMTSKVFSIRYCQKCGHTGMSPNGDPCLYCTPATPDDEIKL